MTQVEQLARFVVEASYEDISAEALAALKVRILDALACAIGAMDGAPIGTLRSYTEELGGAPLATLIGGGKTAPDRAAFYNAALVRYLDFNDSFLAKHETCHPSDNIGAALAGAEYARAAGRDLLTAIAVAYQVQCVLSEKAPVRGRGFDHTVQGAYSAAAGVSRATGLDIAQTANAIAISGTANNALRVTRTGSLSNWKGLAFPCVGAAATQAAFLARHGITGPAAVFEGNKGFIETISGPFELDWSKVGLDAVPRTIVKRFNAEVHSQSAIEGLLELRQKHHINARDVDSIHLETFDVAYNIIGGGEEGEKKSIRRKEEADHSLPYLLAVALLDDGVLPAQYAPERIVREDVQTLLRKVTVVPDEDLSRRFPEQMPCRLTVQMRDGRAFTVEKTDFIGFTTRPLSWEHACDKFSRLTEGFAAESLSQEIIAAVDQLEDITTTDLMAILARAGNATTGDARTGKG
ncbi:MAG TPA: MmgE/PrpD family protein [Armatimonadota bacterium]|nr:MmgE/PrpD family protein [Armatimonadota bacterium]